ncbi:MAG: carbohydrate ABC transporter permease, partial [Anaerolineales bacterium]
MHLSRSVARLTSTLPFVLPGLILFAVFIVGPMLYSFRISFYEWNIVRPERSEWAGLANYARALGDPIFRRAVLNTLAYAAVTVPGQILFGLMVALLLDQNIRARAFFRLIYYLPVITSW